jgi:hypothetical protein
MRYSVVLFAGLTLLSACVQEPVKWTDRTEMPDRHPSPLVFPPESPLDSTLRDSTGSAAFALTQDLLREAGARSMLSVVLATMPEARESLPAEEAMPPMAMAMAAGGDLGTGDAPVDALRCARSLRIVDAPKRGQVAVWWTRRSAGRVALVAAWQMTGAGGADSTAVWRGPIEVDTLDQGAGDANATERGAVGCNRPAPGVAVDSMHGYVHVAYALNAPEGPGVFYAHQMDPRSAFEPPLVIVYGDRKLGVARVATSGNLVAVVYEDPNAPLHRGRIGVAVSRTSGHVFESRVDASPLGKAVDPYVLVQGRAAVVGWSDVDSASTATTTFRLRRGVVR